MVRSRQAMKFGTDEMSEHIVESGYRASRSLFLILEDCHDRISNVCTLVVRQ